MNCGHDTDPTGTVRKKADADWVQEFLAFPVEHKPGTFYTYNSLGTYMLSAIVQKVTGEKVVDYLYPVCSARLASSTPGGRKARKASIPEAGGCTSKRKTLPRWDNCSCRKETGTDSRFCRRMGKGGICLPSRPHCPPGMKPEMLKKAKMSAKTSDWLQGYGYQMWRCRHNAYRADGANGQYILVLPDKDAVIAVTANIPDMQAELNLIWKYLLPAL